MIVTLIVGILLIVILYYLLGLIGIGDPVKTILLLCCLVLVILYAAGVIHA